MDHDQGEIGMQDCFFCGRSGQEVTKVCASRGGLILTSEKKPSKEVALFCKGCLKIMYHVRSVLLMKKKNNIDDVQSAVENETEKLKEASNGDKAR